jgi:negative regulator of sigma E activity
MIDRDTALQLQALLDGELDATEVAVVARRLEQDPEARQLYDELDLTRAVLLRCEPEHKVPQTRDFYWSRIRQGIERGERVETVPESRWWRGWLRWMVPVGATALVGLFLLQRTWVGPEPEPVLLSTEHQVETLLAEATSISFRSESAGMTVVWVQSGSQNFFGSGE